MTKKRKIGLSKISQRASQKSPANSADISNKTVLIVLVLVILVSVSSIILYLQVLKNTQSTISRTPLPNGAGFSEAPIHTPTSGVIGIKIINVTREN